MENTADKFKEFLTKLTPSSSSLFIGMDEETSENYLSIAAHALGVQQIDISILRPELKSGKNKSILVSSARSWIHELNITPHGSFKIGALFGAERLNSESANTLLKTLEEPPSYVYIFLFSETDNLLDTIKSRCRKLHLWQNDVQEDDRFDRGILAKSFAGQSKDLEKIVKNNEIAAFLNGLEKYAQIELRNNPAILQSEFLKEIFTAKKRIKQNANARLQLENLLLKHRGIDHK